MTKISFDIDFNKDSETLLREIQDQAKAEVKKREGKERAKAYLSNLHETVNDKIGTSYKSSTELIRALAEYASPAMRERISGSTVGGRRKTVSMNQELYEQIKEALAKPSPNKAAIARETNVSVVQVRKIATGGYDEKFGDASVESDEADSKPVELPSIDTPTSEPKEQPIASLPESSQIDLPPSAAIPVPENDPIVVEELPAEEENKEMPVATDSIIPDLPPSPSFNEDEESETPKEESDPEIPPPLSFGGQEAEKVLSPVDSNLKSEDEAESDVDAPLPPVSFEESLDEDAPPSLPPSLPPVEETFAGEDQETDTPTSTLPPPTPPGLDFDEFEESNVVEDSPLPPPDLPPVSEDLPNEPEPPATPPSLGDEPNSPPAPPPSPPTPATDAEGEGATTSPPLGRKPGLKLGGSSKKPSLKLGGKSGKSGKPTLNITRPPIKPLPPTPDG